MMIQKITCKKCSRQFNVDFDKAPKDEFLVGCPACQQKYKLKKPSSSQSQPNETVKTSENVNSEVSLKQIPCPTCAKILKIDLNKIAKYPAIIGCGACKTKIKLNDPNAKKEVKTGKLEEIRKPSSVKIDKQAIDPKNHFSYKLYYHTRKIDQVNKLTLFIYLSYLVSSIAKTLSKPNISSLDPQSFLKLRADANALSMQAFNRNVNPILKENGINPRMTSWASSWFVKKLSSRIVMGILESMKIDMNLPYVKKFKQEINAENNKFLQIVTSKYLIFAICMFLHLFIMSGLALDNGFNIIREGFIDLILFLIIHNLPAFGLYKIGSTGLSKSIIVTNIYILYSMILVNIFSVSVYNLESLEFITFIHGFLNFIFAALQVFIWVKKSSTSAMNKLMDKFDALQLKKMALALVILLTIVSFGSYAKNPFQQNEVDNSDTTTLEILETEPSQPLVDSLSIQDVNPEIIADTARPTSEIYYHIEDADGYSNLRAEPNGEIIRRVYPTEQFRVVESVGNYYKVILSDGTMGFIHSSRVFMTDREVN